MTSGLESETPRYRTDKQRLIYTLVVFAGGLCSFYLAIAVYSHIDRIIAPSKQFSGINLPSVEIGNFRLDPDVVLNPIIDTDDDYDPKDRINILVLGLDRRPYEGEACTRADTFFIVSLDAYQNTASVLSFPRDMYIDIPDGANGTYLQRINTTTVFGCGDKYPGGGPGLAKDTLKLNFGININYYAIIDFVGFEQLINSLGGIDFDVPESLGVNSIQFGSGMQHMDGARALQYSRLRPDGDFKRIERQQRVMIEVAKKALGLGLLNDPVGTYDQYKNTIDTDIPDGALPGLGLLAKEIGLDTVKTYSMASFCPEPNVACKPALTSFTTSEGASVQLPVWPLSFQIINQAMPDPGIQGDAATIGIGGPADKVAMVKDYLVQKGIDDTRIVTSGLGLGNEDGRKVFDVNGKDYTAHRVADWLDIGGGEVHVPTAGTLSGADVIILLTDDYQLPEGAVVKK